MSALPLFSPPPPEARPLSQLAAVRRILADGKPHTLPQIHEAVERLRGMKCTDSAISARIRDLRKPEHGGLTVESWGLPGHKGLWAYRVVGGAG